MSQKSKCPKCGSEKLQFTQWYVPFRDCWDAEYECRDCGHIFDKVEEENNHE